MAADSEEEKIAQEAMEEGNDISMTINSPESVSAKTSTPRREEVPDSLAVSENLGSPVKEHESATKENDGAAEDHDSAINSSASTAEPSFEEKENESLVEEEKQEKTPAEEEKQSETPAEEGKQAETPTEEKQAGEIQADKPSVDETPVEPILEPDKIIHNDPDPVNSVVETDKDVSNLQSIDNFNNKIKTAAENDNPDEKIDNSTEECNLKEKDSVEGNNVTLVTEEEEKISENIAQVIEETASRELAIEEVDEAVRNLAELTNKSFSSDEEFLHCDAPIDPVRNANPDAVKNVVDENKSTVTEEKTNDDDDDPTSKKISISPMDCEEQKQSKHNTEKRSKSPSSERAKSPSSERAKSPIGKPKKNALISKSYIESSSDSDTCLSKKLNMKFSKKNKKMDSDSDSSSKYSKVKKKKKKMKYESDLSDSDNAFEREVKGKKHRERNKKDKRKGIKMKIKMPRRWSQEQRMKSSRTPSLDSDDETPQVVSLDIATPSSRSMSPPPRKKSKKDKKGKSTLRLTENNFHRDNKDVACQWLVTEVQEMLRSKKIYLARALDDTLDQLTSGVYVRLKRWTSEDIAEATRRRPNQKTQKMSAAVKKAKVEELISTYVPAKTKYNRNELIKSDLSKDKKRKYESEESEKETKKVKRSDDREKKKSKKSKQKTEEKEKSKKGKHHHQHDSDDNSKDTHGSSKESKETSNKPKEQVNIPKETVNKPEETAQVVEETAQVVEETETYDIPGIEEIVTKTVIEMLSPKLMMQPERVIPGISSIAEKVDANKILETEIQEMKSVPEETQKEKSVPNEIERRKSLTEDHTSETVPEPSKSTETPVQSRPATPEPVIEPEDQAEVVETVKTSDTKKSSISSRDSSPEVSGKKSPGPKEKRNTTDNRRRISSSSSSESRSSSPEIRTKKTQLKKKPPPKKIPEKPKIPPSLEAPSGRYKIPKKTPVEVKNDDKLVKEMQKHEPIKKIPKKKGPPIPLTPKVIFSEKSIQTDPLSCLKYSDGPSVEDLMLLLRGQIRDNPMVLVRWSKSPPVSYDNLVRLRGELNITSGDAPQQPPRPRITLDAYKKKQSERNPRVLQIAMNRGGGHNFAERFRNDTRQRDSSFDRNHNDERHRNNDIQDSRYRNNDMRNMDAQRNRNYDGQRNNNFERGRNFNTRDRQRNSDSDRTCDRSPDQRDRSRNSDSESNRTSDKNSSDSRKFNSPDKQRHSRNRTTNQVERYSSSESLDKQRNSDQGRRQSPEAKTRSPGGRTHSPGDRTRSPGDRTRSPGDRPRSPNTQPETTSSEPQSPDEEMYDPGDPYSPGDSPPDIMSLKTSTPLLKTPAVPLMEIPVTPILDPLKPIPTIFRDHRAPQPCNNDQQTYSENVECGVDVWKPQVSIPVIANAFTPPAGRPNFGPSRSNFNPQLIGQQGYNPPVMVQGLNPKAFVPGFAQTLQVIGSGFNQMIRPNLGPQINPQLTNQSTSSPLLNQGANSPAVMSPLDNQGAASVLLKKESTSALPETVTSSPATTEDKQSTDNLPLEAVLAMGMNNSFLRPQTPPNLGLPASLLLKPPPPPPKKEEDDDAISLYFDDTLSVGTVDERQGGKPLQPSANNPFVKKTTPSATSQMPTPLLIQANQWMAQNTASSSSPYQAAGTSPAACTNPPLPPSSSQVSPSADEEPEHELILQKKRELRELEIKAELLKRQKELMKQQQQAESPTMNEEASRQPTVTNEENYFFKMLDEDQHIPPNFLYRPCYRLLQGQGGCRMPNCSFNHEIPNIEKVMSRMLPLEAMQLYLFVRKKQYRVFYESAFHKLVEKIVQYCDVRLLLLLCYDLVRRSNENEVDWWGSILTAFMHICDNITETHEVELQRVLCYILCQRDCTHEMRSDIAKLSLKTFQYIPEVLLEIFKDTRYSMPQYIANILIEHLLLNKSESWAVHGLEILVRPIPDVVWMNLKMAIIDDIAGVFQNETLKHVLYMKSGRVNQPTSAMLPAPTSMTLLNPASRSSNSLLPPPMPSNLLLSLDIGPNSYNRSEPARNIEPLHTVPVLEMLMNGHDEPEYVKNMYLSLCSAVENQKWLECHSIVKSFGDKKLPRGRCLYNALKEKMVRPHQGFSNIIEALRTTLGKGVNRSLQHMNVVFQMLFGTVGINLMLDLIDEDNLNEAKLIYTLITTQLSFKLDKVISYRSTPITYSQILLRSCKMFFKLDLPNEAYELLTEHQRLPGSNDRIEAIEVLEYLIAHKLFDRKLEEAFQLWKHCYQLKQEICQEYRKPFDPPMHGDLLIVNLLKSKLMAMAIQIWNVMREFPQLLQRKTVRSVLLESFEINDRVLTRDAYRAGRLNGTYHTQMYFYRPHTIRMRSYWSMEEMIVVTEEFLERLEIPQSADLEDFSISIHIEGMADPNSSPEYQMQTVLPEIDDNIEAANERMRMCLEHLRPKIILGPHSNDPKILILNQVSVKSYFRAHEVHQNMR